jgi:flagellar FliL protein
MADKVADKKASKTDKSDAPAQAPEAKKKSPLMKILVIVGILIAQTAAAYFIQKTIFFPSLSVPSEVHADAEAEEGDEGDEAEGGGHGGKEGKAAGSSVAMLDEIIVNPAGTGGRRFLSTVVGLTLKKPATEESVIERMPLIRDAAISLLASKSLDQLASLSYRDTLRHEIQASVNGIMEMEVVKGVVFSTYVLQ